MFKKSPLAGLLTGCGQKWGIVQHYKGQLCSKKDQLCSKLYSNQLLISNIFFWGGGAKWCFDWYFSLFKQWNQYYQLKQKLLVEII